VVPEHYDERLLRLAQKECVEHAPPLLAKIFINICIKRKYYGNILLAGSSKYRRKQSIKLVSLV
jgi:hypothetical protein